MHLIPRQNLEKPQLPATAGALAAVYDRRFWIFDDFGARRAPLQHRQTRDGEDAAATARAATVI
jgi:hypothetical protein